MPAQDNEARLTKQEITDLNFSALKPAQTGTSDEVIHDEGFWHAFDGERLFWQSWSPSTATPKAVIVLTHGYGEHSSRYHHVAAAFAKAGYATIGIDVRGHGRSTGTRAHIDNFDDYVNDLDLLKVHAEQKWPEAPLFCLGHSNGGLITLRYALTQPKDVAGFIVSNPLVAFQVKIPIWKRVPGKILSNIWPTFALPSEIDPKVLTHNQEVVDAYTEDPLVHDIATSRWFTETLRAQKDLKTRASEIVHPALFLLSSDDELCNPNAAEDLFHRLGSSDRELEIYPELFHELLNETNWTDTLKRLIHWIEKHR